MKEKALEEKGTKLEKSADELKAAIIEFSKKVDGFVYPLIIPPIQSIDEDILFEIYPDLNTIGQQANLHVLLYSYGGDAHTAFHIGRLLQRFCKQDLRIYVLREAKSAATLIACAANTIVFSDLSELGPMDPQIKRPDLDQRFSPLAIKHTFELLQDESKKGHDGIVQTLSGKLPDPLVLGELLKTLETGKDYIFKLLRTRMFPEENEEEVARAISERLVTGYPDHGYCIDYQEASDIGLKVESVNKELNQTIFLIMQSYKIIWDKIATLMRQEKKDEAADLYASLKRVAEETITTQVKNSSQKKLRKK